MAKKPHKPYKFQEIKHSPDGMLACGLAILSAALIIAELIITICVRGQAGGMIGLMGIAAFLFSIVGFVFAIISWKDEEAEDLSKRAGTFSNIALIIVNLCLVILGING